MEFIKAYMQNTERRAALNALTQETFGFDFEDWVTSGCFDGAYVPYSYIEDGQLLSNASANIMDFSQNGRSRRYIQIGTVMTAKAFRLRGLARQLMKQLISDYREVCNGFYLFADLDAVMFYEKLGFKQFHEYKYRLKSEYTSLMGSTGGFMPACESDRPQYTAALRSAAVNYALEQRNRVALELFYTLPMESVFYCPPLDAWAVIERGDDDTLALNSLVCTRRLTFSELLSRLPAAASLELGYAPLAEDALYFDSELYSGGEDYRLLYLGDELRSIEADRLCFPVLSHA